ncbi:hypothetical protein MSAN_01263800 [Mycena sanguinolenta]|uniref:Uncharacterized protein n=1 Tax=Mycena sanguinolenta TaxID=230812 RepID=A0A8H7D4M4_9AGAR|nr:hypothetical protein MSAN_01263800 [Mycena sanguinolenta]
MPYLLLLVNVEASVLQRRGWRTGSINLLQISDETQLSRKFSQVAAKILGSPEEDITTNISYNRTGTARPLAFGLTVVGLANPTTEAKERYSASFSWFLTRKFGVPKDQVFMSAIFITLGPCNPPVGITKVPVEIIRNGSVCVVDWFQNCACSRRDLGVHLVTAPLRKFSVPPALH